MNLLSVQTAPSPHHTSYESLTCSHLPVVLLMNRLAVQTSPSYFLWIAYLFKPPHRTSYESLTCSNLPIILLMNRFPVQTSLSHSLWIAYLFKPPHRTGAEEVLDMGPYILGVLVTWRQPDHCDGRMVFWVLVVVPPGKPETQGDRVVYTRRCRHGEINCP